MTKFFKWFWQGESLTGKSFGLISKLILVLLVLPVVAGIAWRGAPGLWSDVITSEQLARLVRNEQKQEQSAEAKESMEVIYLGDPHPASVELALTSKPVKIVCAFGNKGMIQPMSAKGYFCKQNAPGEKPIRYEFEEVRRAMERDEMWLKSGDRPSNIFCLCGEGTLLLTTFPKK